MLLNFSKSSKKSSVSHRIRVHRTLINALAKRGKKQTAVRILSFILNKLKTDKIVNSANNALFYIENAISNIKPLVELDSKNTKGRRPIIKPKPVSTPRAIKLAILWLIEGSNKRTEKTMGLRLYLELLNAFNKKGYALKKKEDLHNLCKLSFFQSKMRS